ncbi:hypothetical protein D3C85_225440 [compost metagenome]
MSKDLMLQYGVESGEVAPEPELSVQTADEALTEVLVDEAAVGGDTLSNHMEQVEETKDIAEQLEELAERTEALADAQEENPPAEGVVEVATESAAREFRTIMRANKLPFVAASFEANESGNRLRDLASDARRVQRIAEGHRANLLDLSNEGAISRFLNRDESKIAKGINALGAAEASLSGSLQSLKDHPVIITHDGIAGFLTQGDQPVLNLKQGVEKDAAHLTHCHDSVTKALSTIASLANGLKASGATKGSSVSKILGGNFVGDLSGCATKGPGLMGNHAFLVDGAAEHGIPKLKRVRNTDKADAKGRGRQIAIGAAIGFLVGTVVGAAIGAAIGNQVGKRDNREGSGAKSAASAADLVSAINTVKGFNKITDYKVDTDAIDKALKDARASMGELSAEDKAATKKACSALEDAISRLVIIADCAYEQAFYDITTMAAVVTAVAKQAGQQAGDE